MLAYEITPDRRPAYRVVVFLFALLAALALGWVAAAHPRGTPEMATEDALARLAPAPARPDVLIVALDSASVNRYGHASSVPRSVLAAGLRRIEAGKPKAVIVDLALDQRSQTGDAALWRTMADGKNVVLGMAYDAARQPPYTADDVRAWHFLDKFCLTNAVTFGPQTQMFPFLDFEPPVSDFTGSARGVGVFDRETDPDGVVRDVRLFYLSQIEDPVPMPPLPPSVPPSPLPINTTVALPNIVLAAAQPVFDLDKTFVEVHAGRAVQISNTIVPPLIIPVDDQGRMQVRYAGGAGRIRAVSLADVAQGKTPANTFDGKVVLVGATDPQDPATDARMTPFGLMPRVEATANAVSTVMSRSWYLQLTTQPHPTVGVVLLVGLVAGLILMLYSGGRAAAVAVALLFVYCLICWLVYDYANVMLPVLPGLLTILMTWVVGILLMLGPFRPIKVPVSPTYVPPPQDVVN